MLLARRPSGVAAWLLNAETKAVLNRDLYKADVQ